MKGGEKGEGGRKEEEATMNPSRLCIYEVPSFYQITNGSAAAVVVVVVFSRRPSSSSLLSPGRLWPRFISRQSRENKGARNGGRAAAALGRPKEETKRID